MTTQTAAPQIPAGTWEIDPVHSDVGFVARHMMVSKVRGRFDEVEGRITIAEDPLASSVEVTVKTASINTRNETRDDDLRSGNFLEVEKFPEMTFKSTGIEVDGDGYKLKGDLRIKDVTKPVVLDLEFNGVGPDPYGGTRMGFSAKTNLDRKDFGMSFNMTLDTGGVVVGDRVSVELEVEAVLQKS